MTRAIHSAVQANELARDPKQYLLWVKKREAARFTAPGWVKLEPSLNGAVLFRNPTRELRALRSGGVL
jgi:hypothetical protein